MAAIDLERIATAPARAIYPRPDLGGFVDSQIAYCARKARKIQQDMDDTVSSEHWYMQDPGPCLTAAAHYQEVKVHGSKSPCYVWAQDQYRRHVNGMIGGLTTFFWAGMGIASGLIAFEVSRRYDLPIAATMATASPLMIAGFIGAGIGLDVRSSEQVVRA